MAVQTDAKTKILYLTRWYPNRYDAMPGLFVRRHAAVSAGFADVATIYLHKVGRGEVVTKKLELEINHSQGFPEITVYYDSYHKINLIEKLLSFIGFIKAWIAASRQLKSEWGIPDIVHVNILTRMGILALWLKWRYGIPYVITEHWTRYLPGIKGFKGWMRKLATRWVVSHASALSSESQTMINILQEYGLRNSNTIVLPHIVDKEYFKPASFKKKDKQIIHVSCFIDSSKNVSGILQVLHQLTLKRNDFTMMLAGDGIDYEKLKNLSDSLGLTDKIVYFRGLLEGKELLEEYKRSSFLLLFSHKENMPVVINEAFASGLPVVSTKVGGIAEYVSEWNGRLVSPGDNEALLQAVNFMLDHYGEFNANKISKFAETNFGEEHVEKTLKELYRFTRKLSD